MFVIGQVLILGIHTLLGAICFLFLGGGDVPQIGDPVFIQNEQT